MNKGAAALHGTDSNDSGFVLEVSDTEKRASLTKGCVFPFTDVVTYEGLKMFKGKIIAIEGTIGAGKSTLCKAMKKLLKFVGIQAVVIKEYVNEILLKKLFLKNPKKYAFAFQLEMCRKRMENYEKAMKLKKKGITVILDRSLNGDMAFERKHHLKGFISADEHEYYLNILKEKSRFLEVPDYCFYLVTGTKTAQKRIAQRAEVDSTRKGEVEAYDDDYLNDLEEAYAYCFQPKFCKMNVKRIDYDEDELSFVEMTRKNVDDVRFREGSLKLSNLMKAAVAA